MTLQTLSTQRDLPGAVSLAIATAKGGDALAGVRVIVPSNISGLSLRRALAARPVVSAGQGGALPGVANVFFSTPEEFAGTIAAAEFANKRMRPLNRTVLGAAVRYVLSNHTTRFSQVAHHEATESALCRAYTELAWLRTPPSELGERGRAVIEFVGAVRSHLDQVAASYYDESVLFEAAAESVARAEVRIEDRMIVLAGHESSPAEARFLEILRELPGSHSIDATDSGVDDTMNHEVPTVSPERAHAACADSDAEVGWVVRQVLEQIEQGTALGDIAVFYPLPDPYLRTLHEHFDRAGVPLSGSNHRRIADTVPGRLLLRLWDEVLEDSMSLDRESVIEIFDAAPLVSVTGKPLRSQSWALIARTAGILGGLDDWRAGLLRHRTNLERRIEEGAAVDLPAGVIASMERHRKESFELGGFVDRLAGLIDGARAATSWSERVEWSRNALASLLPSGDRLDDWPRSAWDALETIENTLQRLAALDSIEPRASAETFVRSLSAELSSAVRSEPFGTGVYVGPLANAPGTTFAHVYIIGLAEGLCPRPVREDTLLDDGERARFDQKLSSRIDRVAQERRNFAAATAAAVSTLSLVTPRGDHRNGSHRTVSRWWLESLRAVCGDETIDSQSWMNIDPSHVEAEDSFAQSLQRSIGRSVVANRADVILQASYVSSLGGDIGPSTLPPSLERGLAISNERFAGFTRHNGNLAGGQSFGTGEVISSTRLQDWATCPRRYFFRHELELGEIERPEEIVDLSHLDRGSLVHAILEDFIRDAIPAGGGSSLDPGQPWGDEDRRRLLAYAKERFDEYEAQGRTGRSLLWEIQREALLADLDQFLLEDSALRAELNMSPFGVEVAFGMDGDASVPPARVLLENGNTLALRGFIDRIDVRSDSSAVVLDYKTGRARTSHKELERDPVSGGEQLQLGVYAEAVRSFMDTQRVDAFYWHTSSRGEFERRGYTWTAERRTRFVEAVETINHGITHGDFPPNPGEWSGYHLNFDNCAFCEFDRVCGTDRDREFHAVVESGEIDRFVELKSGPPEESTDG